MSEDALSLHSGSFHGTKVRLSGCAPGREVVRLEPRFRSETRKNPFFPGALTENGVWKRIAPPLRQAESRALPNERNIPNETEATADVAVLLQQEGNKLKCRIPSETRHYPAVLDYEGRPVSASPSCEIVREPGVLAGHSRTTLEILTEACCCSEGDDLM